MLQDCILFIQYASARQTETHRLSRNTDYQVGSSYQEANYEHGEIPLFGRGISDVHFRFIPNPQLNVWQVEFLGVTETFLNGIEVNGSADAPFELYDDAEISVPGATLSVRLYESGDDLYGSGAIESWIKMQDLIHSAVYDDLASSRGQKEAASADPLTEQAVVRDLLQVHTETQMGKASEELIAEIVRSALRIAILRSIASGSVDEWGDGDRAGFERPGQLSSRAGELIGKLGLSLQMQTVESDTREMEARFNSVFDEAVVLMPIGDRRAIAEWFIASNVWNAIYNFGPITDLMALPMITEIMIVRHDLIYIERAGGLERYDYGFASEDRLLNILKRLTNEAGREINRLDAMVDFRLKDGSRVNAIINPLSRRGPCVTIRKHRKDARFTLQTLCHDFHSLSSNMMRFLQSCVSARKNLIVSGGTGSGKTTLLNALSAGIPDNQRVVTIEDTAELNLGNSHVVSLETRPANVEGEGEVSIRDLVKNSLRMRPDRIIVGECRGGEAVDMLQALNTGHAGSMTTAHANGPSEMLMRLEVMVLQGEPNLPIAAIRQQIANAIDIVVQLQKVPIPGSSGKDMKLITDIAEVVGLHPVTGDIIVESIFQLRGFYPDQSPRHIFMGYMPSFVEEIEEARPVYERGHQAGQPVAFEELFFADEVA